MERGRGSMETCSAKRDVKGNVGMVFIIICLSCMNAYTSVAACLQVTLVTHYTILFTGNRGNVCSVHSLSA